MNTETLLSKALIGGALAVVALLGSCMSTVYVDPGNVGVVIHKAGGGVDPTPLGPGFHLRNPLVTAIEEYPVKMQTIVLAKSQKEGGAENEEINVNSQEGQPLSLDVSLSFELDPHQTPILYKTFRTDIETVTHTYVKQSIRQALQETVGQEEIADVLGPKKAEMARFAQAKISRALAAYGFMVKQFTVNEMRPPQSVIDAINQKNVMQQAALTAQNQLQKQRFEAQGDSIAAYGRAMAIMGEAKAKAQAAELLARQPSSATYLRMLELENQKAAIAKWDGNLPSWMGGGAPIPFIDVMKAQQR